MISLTCIISILVTAKTVSGETSCNKPVDIAFLIDTSRSVWIVDYEKHLIPFVYDVVNKLDVGQGTQQSRVAAVTFSDRVEIQFNFDKFSTKQEVLDAIKNIVHDKGNATRTYLGLKETRLRIFDATKGERPGIKNVVVVLTDGVTNAGSYDVFKDGDKAETQKEAQLLKDEIDATVFAIGIGGTNDEELKGIASDPDEKFVIKKEGFEQLNTDKVKNELVDRTCEVVDPNPQKETPDCFNLKADIFFALDGSSSIHSYTNFKKELQFVKEVVDQIEIGPNDAQVGVLVFSTTSRMQFHLDYSHDKATLTKAIDDIKWTGGDTYTNKAIAMARDEGLKVGARSNVPKILVVITDGRSSRSDLTDKELRDLDKNLITVFAIGVGPERVNFQDELMKMASSAEHMFDVENLDRLVDIRKEFVETLCEDGSNIIDNEKPQGTEECKETKADILFLIDGSTSINNKDTFKKELSFIAELIDTMNIGEQLTRIAAVQFATEPQVEFRFGDHTTKDDVVSAVLDIKWKMGDTYLHLALDKAVNDVMHPDNLRKDVPHILVLLSDGVSTIRSKTQEKVDEIKESRKDVIIFGIGIGRYRNMRELKSIVSEPVESHAFEVESQDALTEIRSKLAVQLCQADQTAEKVCFQKKADIIFIADASTSIGFMDFEKLKKFLVDVTESFTVGADDIQIGLITFANTSKTEFHLNSFTSNEGVKEKLEKIKWTTGNTYTHLALEELLTSGFTDSAGARGNVPHIVIVVTDGWSRKPDLTKEMAAKIKENNVVVFTIGVGPYLDKKELEAMASAPISRHVFMVTDYDALKTIQNSVASRACSVEAPAKEESRKTIDGHINRFRDQKVSLDKPTDNENLAEEMRRLQNMRAFINNRRNTMIKKNQEEEFRKEEEREELLTVLKKLLNENDIRSRK